MKIIKSLLIIFFLCTRSESYAQEISLSDIDDRFEWMDANINSMTTAVPQCIQVPAFSGINETSHTLDLASSGKWFPAGTNVQKDKLLDIKWFTDSIVSRPEKYKVLYRIDPRFRFPQVFIQKLDYSTNVYVSDFHQFKNGILKQYQLNPDLEVKNRVDDFVSYFTFKERPKIQVKKGDVINITLDNNLEYFSGNSQMNVELGGEGDNPLLIYTKSSIPDNKIIFSWIEQWCEDGITPKRPEYTENCLAREGKYFDALKDLKTFEGKIDNAAFDSNKDGIKSCPEGHPPGSDHRNHKPLCYYDKGRGMIFSINGVQIKPIGEKFISSPFTGKDFFYNKSEQDGDLELTTTWRIQGMYDVGRFFPQTMNYGDFLAWGSVARWGEGSMPGFSASNFYISLNTYRSEMYMNYMHFGRYLMDIEIGNSNDSLNKGDIDGIKVEYIIMEDGTPSDSTPGTSVDKNFRGNAEKTGSLWIRVISPDDRMIGNVKVKIANYTGSTLFSNFIFNKIIKPLREKLNSVSEVIYRNLVDNPVLQNIARSMLTIYVIIYGLTYLAGATQITATDLVSRILKITIIVILFSETSWTFFSKNLFDMFVYGTDYLLTSILGVSSSAGNVFGFIDPVFERYTDGTLWQLLFIQLLQFHNGLTFFAILLIYSILIYFKSLIEVIVSYCLAFLGLAVMISIAPFFIMLMLFERTKSIFDNWLSTLFSYMIQPTILLVFLLLIEQIINEQLSKALVEACWDTLIPIRIGLDLTHMNIPISFSFKLPFLDGIPFYIPQVSSIDNIGDFFSKPGTFARIATSSLLFFGLCKLASGLVAYSTIITQQLTNVEAATQEARTRANNPVSDIVNDIGKLTKPISGAAKSVGRFAIDKVINQKIEHRHDIKKGQADQDIDYSDVNRKSGDKIGLNKKDK